MTFAVQVLNVYFKFYLMFCLEMTVIIEILKKGKDEGNKSNNSRSLRELSVKRDTLFVREIPTKSVDPFRGIDPYPIIKNFKGFRKLPCVEMVSILGKSLLIALCIKMESSNCTGSKGGDQQPEQDKWSRRFAFFSCI